MGADMLVMVMTGIGRQVDQTRLVVSFGCVCKEVMRLLIQEELTVLLSFCEVP